MSDFKIEYYQYSPEDMSEYAPKFDDTLDVFTVCSVYTKRPSNYFRIKWKRHYFYCPYTDLHCENNFFKSLLSIFKGEDGIFSGGFSSQGASWGWELQGDGDTVAIKANWQDLRAHDADGELAKDKTPLLDHEQRYNDFDSLTLSRQAFMDAWLPFLSYLHQELESIQRYYPYLRDAYNDRYSSAKLIEEMASFTTSQSASMNSDLEIDYFHYIFNLENMGVKPDFGHTADYLLSAFSFYAGYQYFEYQNFFRIKWKQHYFYFSYMNLGYENNFFKSLLSIFKGEDGIFSGCFFPQGENWEWELQGDGDTVTIKADWQDLCAHDEDGWFAREKTPILDDEQRYNDFDLLTLSRQAFMDAWLPFLSYLHQEFEKITEAYPHLRETYSDDSHSSAKLIKEMVLLATPRDV